MHLTSKRKYEKPLVTHSATFVNKKFAVELVCTCLLSRNENVAVGVSRVPNVSFSELICNGGTPTSYDLADTDNGSHL